MKAEVVKTPITAIQVLLWGKRSV